MTDKQLQRANEIKKDIALLDKIKNVGIVYSGDGVEDIFNHPAYTEFEKIQERLNRQWQKLIFDKITALQKEFAKL